MVGRVGTFSKNRGRLLKHEIADRFFAAAVKQAHLRRYLLGEHFRPLEAQLLSADSENKLLTTPVPSATLRQECKRFQPVQVGG